MSVFWHFIPNYWELLVQVLHAYCTSLSTLDYNFYSIMKLCHIKCYHPACVSADGGHFEHMMWTGWWRSCRSLSSGTILLSLRVIDMTREGPITWLPRISSTDFHFHVAFMRFQVTAFKALSSASYKRACIRTCPIRCLQWSALLSTCRRTFNIQGRSQKFVWGV